ncbi:MAG: hypothetical protein ABSH34_31265 [Verrucomicrobiota bacterium]|jgi:hypothetical protein
MNITTLTPQQLRKAADLKENIDALQEQLNAILGGGETPTPVAPEEPERPKNGRRKRRKKVSAEGRANISAAAKARWAARRMGKKSVTVAAESEQPLEKPKRKRSAAWSKALSEAMKARWAKARRAGRSRL